MTNEKFLAILSLLWKIIETFSSFFLNIYLFKLAHGDFNFLLLYAAFNAVVGCTLDYFFMKYIRPDNANILFRLSFACEIVSISMLLIMQDQIMSLIWVFAFLQRFAQIAYYSVYEVTLIHSTRSHSLSSYVAGVQILSSIVTLLAPITIGYVITDFSWHLVFILILIDALIAVFIATKVNFRVIHNGFRPIKFWQKAARNRTIRSAYGTMFLKRLSSTDGVLGYLIPVLLFLALGTEFSVGSYDSLFSIIYIMMLEAVRVLNKKGIPKKFYVPFALLAFLSALNMLRDFSMFSILLFYFTIKTGGSVIMTESSSMIYSIGSQEKLANYTREHQFTWNIFLELGNLVGILVAYVVYNNFYHQTAFVTVIVILMGFFVLQAYVLQKIENRPQNT